jgi:hypothetical protein
VTLVLLILAVIWAAVLIPPALRSRAEGRPADSITAFHRQLAVLRRAGPRAGHGSDSAMSPRSGGFRSLTSASASASHASSPVAALARANAGRVAPRRMAAPPRRNSARRRRRDIFLSLLVASGSTLVLGAIPGMHMLWVVNVAADVLLVGYVALLVRQRNLATERALKVRLLPTARRHEAQQEAEGRWADGDSGWLGAEPVLLHRSAT